MSLTYRHRTSWKQDELYEAFASGLQDAIADPNISFETKQVLTGFVINYEFDNYKDKIQENIEKGCRWDDIVKHQEMQLTPEEHEQLTKMTEKLVLISQMTCRPEQKKT